MHEQEGVKMGEIRRVTEPADWYNEPKGEEVPKFRLKKFRRSVLARTTDIGSKCKNQSGGEKHNFYSNKKNL